MEHFACCFTGHRNLPQTEYNLLKMRLLNTVRTLAGEGVAYFITGGAVGFDTLAAQCVLTLRECELPGIKLALFLPCHGQDARWTEADRAEYRRIYHAADYKAVLAPAYYDGCMRARNQLMVEKSDVCVAYVKRFGSGAGQTLRMAQAAGRRIISLA